MCQTKLSVRKSSGLTVQEWDCSKAQPAREAPRPLYSHTVFANTETWQAGTRTAPGTYHIGIKWWWNLLLQEVSPAERFKEWMLLNFKLQRGTQIVGVSETHPASGCTHGRKPTPSGSVLSVCCAVQALLLSILLLSNTTAAKTGIHLFACPYKLVSF